MNTTKVRNLDLRNAHSSTEYYLNTKQDRRQARRGGVMSTGWFPVSKALLGKVLSLPDGSEILAVEDRGVTYLADEMRRNFVGVYVSHPDIPPPEVEGGPYRNVRYSVIDGRPSVWEIISEEEL